MSTSGKTGMSGFMSRNPSIDEVTVIDGVITPSASRTLPPIMVSTAAQVDFSLGQTGQKFHLRRDYQPLA